VAIFDRSRRRRDARRGYCNISIDVPQAMVHYCVTGYAGAEAIMAAVPETM
jgi:hypothetical protein